MSSHALRHLNLLIADHAHSRKMLHHSNATRRMFDYAQRLCASERRNQHGFLIAKCFYRNLYYYLNARCHQNSSNSQFAEKFCKVEFWPEVDILYVSGRFGGR